MGEQRRRQLTVVAQDPTVVVGGKVLAAKVQVPWEALSPGPCGYRVHVTDFDASSGKLYRPATGEFDKQPYAATDRVDDYLDHPGFHAQNVYAIVMSTLGRFEYALGRRISWGFHSHQLNVAPHAFADANAFYSREDRGLLLGYFAGKKGPVYTCLSHDVVAHETTHALLDGLRRRFDEPSSEDQAAFHEGFADIVALLSVLAQQELIEHLLPRTKGQPNLVARDELNLGKLRDSPLMGLAEQMGSETQATRGRPLRSSLHVPAQAGVLDRPEYKEEHRRGEVLVAAMMSAYIEVWLRRLQPLGEIRPGQLGRARVAEEGSKAAAYLLTMAIRALDYTPPVHITFGDYLTSLLTADVELWPDDTTYRFREVLQASFEGYGIRPYKGRNPRTPGAWDPVPEDLDYSGVHFEPMQRDPDEVFRFIWDNRKRLDLNSHGYTQVLSVRPCIRLALDGFTLRETVAEYIQIADVRASDLRTLKVRRPDGMAASDPVRLCGGGTLVFDERGRLKYHVRHAVDEPEQGDRLAYWWGLGTMKKTSRPFAAIHRTRAVGDGYLARKEGW